MVSLNTAVNYLLLRGASEISGFGRSKMRTVVAACLGGLYSGICLIGGHSLSGMMIVRCVILIIVSVIAFGISVQSLRSGIVFMILNFSLEGVLQLINQVNEITMTFCACVISLLCRFAISGSPMRKRLISVIINYRGKAVKIKALHDTGNSLVDPISGEKMLVINHAVASELTGLTKEELASPINTLREGRVGGMWLVPFSSVGNANGLMLAIRFSDAILDGKPVSIVAALAAEGLEDYDALIGG